MRRGRPKVALTLTLEERETLGRWVRRPTTAQALGTSVGRRLPGSLAERHDAHQHGAFLRDWERPGSRLLRLEDGFFDQPARRDHLEIELTRLWVRRQRRP